MNVACNGGSTGTATAIVAGGSGTFSYSWSTSPAQTTQTATGLSIGNYGVVVTDNNGCTVSQSANVLITAPSNSIAVTTSQVNVACNAGNTGSATAIVAGGSGAFSYSWTTSPVQTTATATGLSATPGNYTVTVTDNNGCTVSQKASVLITQPTNSISVTTSQVNVACNAGNTGSATAIVAGGSGTFSYAWTTSPVQTTATATGLSATPGTYTVTVTDNNGCTVSQKANVLITQPTNSISVTTSQVNVACNGGSTGTATAIVAGGSGTFSYSWSTSPAQTTQTATGLSIGNYGVVVTDNNGCTVSQSANVLITAPSNSIAVTTSQVNVACNAGNTGSATAIVAGGSGAFSYSWTTSPVQTTATATGLSATPGNYTVTVTDNNGCTVSQKASVLITQPTNSISVTTSQVNVACNAGNTGSATAIVAGEAERSRMHGPHHRYRRPQQQQDYQQHREPIL